MSFDWRQYLIIARNINATEAPSCNDETRWRNAISRAYYAAYCTSSDFLKHVGKYPPGNLRNHRGDPLGSHERVAYTFKASDIPAWKTIGRLLYDMKSSRKKADYDPSVPSLRSLAEITIESSSSVISKIDALRAPKTP